jgi:hypothetical protein
MGETKRFASEARSDRRTTPICDRRLGRVYGVSHTRLLGSHPSGHSFTTKIKPLLAAYTDEPGSAGSVEYAGLTARLCIELSWIKT